MVAALFYMLDRKVFRKKKKKKMRVDHVAAVL